MANKSTLPRETVRSYALQIARGLSYLHNNGVIHGDLRPEHVLINERGEVKLCDFGASVSVNKDSNATFMGSPAYAPPEAENGRISMATDVWALGCLMYALASKKLPFAVKTWKDHKAAITETTVTNLKLSPSISPSLTSLLKSIFRYFPSDRPSITEVLQHEYFTKTNTSSNGTSVSSSLSKRQPTHRSVETIRSDKENRNEMNLLGKNTAPNYKEMIGERLGMKERKRREVEDRPMQCLSLSPLKTEGLILREIELDRKTILVNKQGITIRGETDSMTVSPDGS